MEDLLQTGFKLTLAIFVFKVHARTHTRTDTHSLVKYLKGEIFAWKVFRENSTVLWL